MSVAKIKFGKQNEASYDDFYEVDISTTASLTEKDYKELTGAMETISNVLDNHINTIRAEKAAKDEENG